MNALRPLNRQTCPPQQTYPERIVQFGAGNFLRGFVDWIIEQLNRQTSFASSIVVVKVTPGRYDDLDAQDCLFHVHLEGIQAGSPVSETTLISSISRTLYPYDNYEAYAALARQPEIRFLISNTTEAGIQYHAGDLAADRPPQSFPAKLTQFLYERCRHFDGAADKGCIVIPTELIENNGTQLKALVLQYAHEWGLPAAFEAWIQQHNLFCNTLVDRIVPGFPQASSEALFNQIGCSDTQLVMGEPYHSWVIEAPDSLKLELPVAQTALNVRIVADVTPYRETKVRILNGLHTSMALIGTLAGLQTVGECMQHPVLTPFLLAEGYHEIIPSMDLPRADLEQFMQAVLDRFRNPVIQHYLRSITLNSSAKVRPRIITSIQAYVAKQHTLPPRLVLALTAFIRLYRGEWQGQPVTLNDNPDVLRWIQEQWQSAASPAAAQAILSSSALWGTDLTQVPHLLEQVTQYLIALDTIGILPLLQQINEESS